MEACVARCSTASNSPLVKTLTRSINRKFLSSVRCSSSDASIHFRGNVELKRRAYDALLLDAGGTLLQLDKPVATTYAAIGRKYGLVATDDEIKQGFKRAFSAPWPKKLRYEGDGRPFWRLVVKEATGCALNDYFEEVYEVMNGLENTMLYKNQGRLV